MVTAPEFEPPCSTGTGNSPPTRKLASLPLVVTRFGSARICRTCSCCRALMKAPRFSFGLKAKRLSACEIFRVATPGFAPEAEVDWPLVEPAPALPADCPTDPPNALKPDMPLTPDTHNCP